MPVRRRSVAGSLPRRGVGCCVPQLTHLRSQDIHRRQPLGRSGFLAPAPPSWPGLFFWWRRSCYGEQRPSVPPTQMKATHALLRMIKVSSGGAKLQGRGRPWPTRLPIASARHLLAFCMAFRCVEGQRLLSLSRPPRDERGGRCDGAIRRLSSGCRRGCARCDGHNRFLHCGRIPDRVQASYQTAVNSSEAVRRATSRPRPHGFQ